MTAVAAVQNSAVRRHFCEIYWLAVGADAVGGQLKQSMAMLYKQLAGKAATEEKDDHELQVMLVQAMAGKRRALVVLDDPWVPEQVRGHILIPYRSCCLLL